ncbi:MAG: DUF4369 domain-containing protein [Bacteroidales bacterium]|nr:DUF4369 domain-containing protein [Bacteroidales bacterium]
MKSGKYIFHAFAFFIIFIFSCNTPLPDDEVCEITGKISGGEGKQLVLMELNSKNIFAIDSTVLKNESGEFHFQFIPKEAGMFLLQNESNESIILIIHKGDRISINAKYSTIAEAYRIQGSEQSLLLQSYLTKTKRRRDQVDELYVTFRSNQHDSDFYLVRDSLNMIFDSIKINQKKLVMEFIEKHPATLAALFAINYRFGNNYLLNEEIDVEYFEKIDSGLSIKYPRNKHSIDHHQRVLNIKTRQQETNGEK